MKSRILNSLNLAVSYADWLVPLIVAVVVSILGADERLDIKVVQSTVLAVLSLMCLTAIRDGLNWRAVDHKIDYLKDHVVVLSKSDELLLDRERTGVERILDGVVGFNWLDEIESAKEVVIVKIKADFTNNPTFFTLLERVLNRGGSVTIILSDPRAPSTLQRYFDEPTALSSSRPVKGSKSNPWVNGLEEIAADIHRLKIWHDELVSEGRQLGNLRLGVSTIYPTHAFLKFDNRLYVYHYPYMGRGFHAPCSLFTREDRPVYRYLVECMSAVVRESASLPESADDIWIRCKRGEFSDRTVERLEVAIRRVR